MSFSQYNSNDDDTKIEELKPKFRSVMIERSTLQPAQKVGVPGLKEGSVFTKSPQQAGQTVTNKSGWNVVNAKPVPVYGLEKGTVHIEDEPCIVSSRLESSFRVRSVQAQFDTEAAEASCKTIDSLKYKVFLFAGADNSTHLEVMLMKGNRREFKREREAIISAAKGLGAVERAPDVSRNFTIPSSMKSLYVAPKMNDLEMTLNRANDQIHSSHRDETLFALEDLSFRTNGKKAHTETAHKLSVLLMQNKGGICDLIVSSYVAMSGDMKDETSAQICDACLSILENGINSIIKSDDFLDQECRFLIEQLVPSLVQNVKSLKCHRHTCLALRCLSLLVNNSSLACKTVDRTIIGGVIEQAVKIGKREHLMLEEAALSTRDVLQRKLDVF